MKTKPLDEFPKNRRTKDGFATYCKPCHNAKGQATRKRLYGGSRHYHLLNRYGIGADEVAAMVEEQGRVCPICGKPDPEHVDHDHVTGVIRGILCFDCNGGLGQFGDDIDRLRSAIASLERAARKERVIQPVVRRRKSAPPSLFDDGEAR